jgi:lipopolysaccharide export system protein LptA
MIYNLSSKMKIIIIVLLITILDAGFLYSQDRIDFSDLTESDLSPEEAESSLRVTGEDTIYHGNVSVDTESNVITLTNDPYIITATHFVKADTIIWYRNDGIIELDKNTRIRSFETDDVAAGDKAFYYQDPVDMLASIKGNADETQRAFIFSSPNVVEADQIIILDEDTYEAKGNVEFHNTDDENKATANYGIYKKSEDVLELSGNSYIFYNDIKSYADEITAFLNENRSLMEGNARIISGTNVAKAGSIEMFDEEDKRRAILTKDAVLEQFGRQDTDRKEGAVRQAKSQKITFIEDNATGDRELYMTGDSTVYEYSNPDSPLQGDPYRIIKAQDIDYLEKSDKTQIILKNNASFEQINYRVKGRQGDNATIEKYTEMIAKADDIDVNYNSDRTKEVINLNGNTSIVSPDRTIFSDKGTITDRNHAVMTGNVEVYEHDIELTEIKTEAYARKMEAFNIDDLPNSRYILTGNVEVYQGDDYASGDYMELSNKDNTIIIDGRAFYRGEQTQASADYIKSKEYAGGKRTYLLEGDASVKQGNDYASGNTINMDERDDTASIVGDAYYTDGVRQVYADSIDSDDMSRTSSNTTKLTLTGNVRFLEPGRSIRSSHAVVFQEELPGGSGEPIINNSAYLTGNVEIIDDNQGVTISGNLVDYIELSPKKTVANISGNAIVAQTDGTMFADIITYTEEEGKKMADNSVMDYINVTGVGDVRVISADNIITSDFGELKRKTPPETSLNKDEIIFKGSVVVDGEELDATTETLTLLREPIDGSELIEEKWTLTGNAIIDQPQRHAEAGVVEYIKTYPTKLASEAEETYRFYYEAILTEELAEEEESQPSALSRKADDDDDDDGKPDSSRRKEDENSSNPTSFTQPILRGKLPPPSLDDIFNDDDDDDDDDGQDSIQDTIDDYTKLLSDDEMNRVEPFSDKKREFDNKRQIKGDAVFYNIKRSEGKEVETMEAINKATYNDPRLDVSGETIKFIIISYAQSGKDDDYKFYINEGMVDKETKGRYVNYGESKDEEESDEDADDDERRRDTDSLLLFSKVNPHQLTNISYQEENDDDDDNEDDSQNDKEDEDKTGIDMEKQRAADTEENHDDNQTQTDTPDTVKRNTTDDGMIRAMIRDYEQKIIVEGDEIHGDYAINEVNEESIRLKVWNKVIFYSEEDEFTANSEFVDFNRDSFVVEEESYHDDHIEIYDNVKFNSEDEITGRATYAIVDINSYEDIQEANLYEDAQLRQYQIDDIVTLSGGQIYLNGTENYVVSTDNAVLESRAQGLTVTADRIEYYNELERAYARGNVLTEQGGNIFTSNYLYYEEETQLITLKGSVRYILEDSIDGDASEITYDIETGEIVSESGSADIESEGSGGGFDGGEGFPGGGSGGGDSGGGEEGENSSAGGNNGEGNEEEDDNDNDDDNDDDNDNDDDDDDGKPFNAGG